MIRLVGEKIISTSVQSEHCVSKHSLRLLRRKVVRNVNHTVSSPQKAEHLEFAAFENPLRVCSEIRSVRFHRNVVLINNYSRLKNRNESVQTEGLVK